MKNIILCLNLLLPGILAFSQNVGIGTTTPLFKLDVRGGNINTDSAYCIGSNIVLTVEGSNLFVGHRPGQHIAGMSGYNTGTGIKALSSNTVGKYNTANGYAALFSNTTGYDNTANGYSSLHFNTTGGGNTANGYYALYSNSTGSENTANGQSALFVNTTGGSNTAYGHSSLFSNSAGIVNTAIGHSALYSNNTGSYNTASGYLALYKNTTGFYNTANGYDALHSNTTGYYNTASGVQALFSNTAGSKNTAIGLNALYATAASDGNTAVGFKAGALFNNGYFNTFIGDEADANADGHYNSIAIGNASTVTAPVQVRIGASFITSIGGYQNWTSLSDGRFKKNVKEDVKGLDFIMKLRPVTYNLDVSGISQELNESRGRATATLIQRSISEKERIVYSGFIAQEVEQVSKQTGYDFSGVDKPKNANDFYGLRYAEFVVPLVKAVQELSALVQDLQKNRLIQDDQIKLLTQLLSNKN